MSKEKRRNLWSGFYMDCASTQGLKMWILVSSSNIKKNRMKISIYQTWISCYLGKVCYGVFYIETNDI